MPRILFGLLAALALAAGGGAKAQDAGPGGYEALSPGNQMIVDSIHGTLSPDSTLTKDDIATMRDGTGWGNAYNQLYQEGQVTERNLGQAIKQHLGAGPVKAESAPTDGAAAPTATGDAAASSAANLPPGRAGTVSGRGAAKGHGGDITVTTGAGASVAVGRGAAVNAGGGGSGADAKINAGGGAGGTQNPAGITRGAGGQGQGHGSGGRGR